MPTYFSLFWNLFFCSIGHAVYRSMLDFLNAGRRAGQKLAAPVGWSHSRNSACKFRSGLCFASPESCISTCSEFLLGVIAFVGIAHHCFGAFCNSVSHSFSFFFSLSLLFGLPSFRLPHQFRRPACLGAALELCVRPLNICRELRNPCLTYVIPYSVCRHALIVAPMFSYI